MVEFRELTMGDELMYCDYMREWIDHDEKIVPTITNTTLFLIEDDEIIGAANIRHNLNEQLKKIGGHVGYGIRKKHRGKGFGNKILKKSLDYLSRIGVREALVTCTEDNEASVAVIKHNGGEEIESSTLEDGTVVRRFQIEIA